MARVTFGVPCSIRQCQASWQTPSWSGCPLNDGFCEQVCRRSCPLVDQNITSWHSRWAGIRVLYSLSCGNGAPSSLDKKFQKSPITSMPLGAHREVLIGPRWPPGSPHWVLRPLERFQSPCESLTPRGRGFELSGNSVQRSTRERWSAEAAQATIPLQGLRLDLAPLARWF